LGIWDPQDIQPLELKPYFQAFLTQHTADDLKRYSGGTSTLAKRSQVYLDHLKIEQILKEPDAAKRADALLPFFLFTNANAEGPTQREAQFQLWRSCGQAGASCLVPVFKNPKYAAMQSDIMTVWGNEQYHDSIPILIDLLKSENQFWGSQTPAERGRWVNMSPSNAPTMPQILSKNRIQMVLFVFKQLGDGRAKPVLEETKRYWNALYPNDIRNNFADDCDQALLSIQNSANGTNR